MASSKEIDATREVMEKLQELHGAPPAISIPDLATWARLIVSNKPGVTYKQPPKGIKVVNKSTIEWPPSIDQDDDDDDNGKKKSKSKKIKTEKDRNESHRIITLSDSDDDRSISGNNRRNINSSAAAAASTGDNDMAATWKRSRFNCNQPISISPTSFASTSSATQSPMSRSSSSSSSSSLLTTHHHYDSPPSSPLTPLSLSQPSGRSPASSSSSMLATGSSLASATAPTYDCFQVLARCVSSIINDNHEIMLYGDEITTGTAETIIIKAIKKSGKIVSSKDLVIKCQPDGGSVDASTPAMIVGRLAGGSLTPQGVYKCVCDITDRMVHVSVKVVFTQVKDQDNAEAGERDIDLGMHELFVPARIMNMEPLMEVHRHIIKYVLNHEKLPADSKPIQEWLITPKILDEVTEYEYQIDDSLKLERRLTDNSPLVYYVKTWNKTLWRALIEWSHN